jgi:DNA-binding IscR family transcriptional regulator
MIVIAKAPELEGILQKDIAENQDISLKYLDSIISSLKLKGLIVNVRGK